LAAKTTQDLHQPGDKLATKTICAVLFDNTWAARYGQGLRSADDKWQKLNKSSQ